MERNELRKGVALFVENLCDTFLDPLAAFEISPGSVRIFDDLDGVAVWINFREKIREHYEWKPGERTSLEQAVADLAQVYGFDFGHCVSGGSGKGYTDWQGIYLG